MTLLYPAWLTLLGLGPLIVLLHVRRPRRRLASSAVIWRRVSQASELAAGTQGGSVNWPLILQLAALLMLALALARPTSGFGAGADHRVYLVDVSYGMLAVENDERLVDRAVAWLEREMLDLPPTVMVSVVSVGKRPHPVVVRSRGAGIRGWAEGVTGWATDADWRSALALVAGTMPPREHVAITVLTAKSSGQPLSDAIRDGGFEPLDIRVVEFGETPFNVGIVEVSAFPDTTTPGTFTVVGALAATHVADDVSVVLERTASDSRQPEEIGRVALDIRESSHTPFEFGRVTASGGPLRVRVLADDAYPTDDEVQLPLRSETPRLLVVGEPLSQLARLLTLLPDVEVFVMDSLTELADEFDLVIVTDGSVTGVPATSTLWLGTVPGGRAAAPRVAVPEVTTWARHHALSSSDWSGLRVDEVYAGPLLAGATAIASSGNIPLIQARLVDVGYQVIVAFPLETSNWVDLTSFPTFIAQLVDLVIPPERRVGSTACISGLPCRLEARFADPELGAVLPDGSRWPPREAWVPMKDEFAEGYWALGGSELSFVPEVPGIVRTLGRQVDGVLSVVASPTGFVSAATAPRDVDEHGDADGVRVPRPGSVPFTGSLVVLGLMLVTVNAILVWLHRVRWFRSRASWVLASTFVVVAALVAALLRLPVPSPHQQPRQIAIVDERARTLEDQYSALSQVIVTGSGAVAPSVIDDESGWAPRATDLYDGLEIGLGLAAASSTDSILVYPQSGRGPTSAEVSVLAARARSAGVSIDLVPYEGPVAKAIEVTALHLPARINASSTVEALVTVESAVDASVVLRVAFDDEVLADADVDVSVGANALRVPLQFESASAGELSLTLSVEDQGVIETAVTFVEVVAAPTVLIVGPDPTATDTMASALELQGFSVDVQPALNVPWSLDDWNDVDLLVLLDVSAHSLHSTQLASLEEWVGQRGGGLLLLGGATAFGPGGYLRTPLDDLSPLSSQVPSEAPEVTMLFVIDRSGSMQQAVGDTTRMGIAKEATVEAMTLLGPGSLVGVVVYDESAEVLVPLTPIEEMDVVAQAVAGVRANGGTALHPALVEASTVLQGVESAATHVVVLTDGMSQPGEFRSAIADLRSLGATISFVGIGSGTDKIQLNDLAAMAGGALHITDDVRALPSILAQEALLASQDLVREGDVDTRRHEPPPPLAQDLPPTGRIGGYVLTEAKPAAEILVSTFEEEPAPLLATWRYGLGRVAAFASHGAGNWTEAWFSGAMFAPIWGQFARWATATDVPDALDLTASVDGSTVWVTAHAFDEDGSTAVGRDLVVRVQGPDSVITEAGLPEIRPGTYEASLETREAGTYGVSVRSTLGDEIGALRVVVGSDAVRSSDTGPLLAMPTLTGGHVLSTAPESDEQSLRTIWRPESVVGPWLLLALVAFLASLVVTYGVPRWSDVVLAQRSLRSRLNRA